MFNPIRSRAKWKPLLVLVLALSGLGAGAAGAQDFTVGWSPRSGDVWVDTWAGDMNRYGGRYREPFVDELVRYHGAPRPLVLELLDRRGWAPGDVYLACSIASIIGRPCRYVVDVYERDRGQGWGVVAQRLGIKPGSPEFHRMKKGFVSSYDRWARPIDLDDQLRRDFPNRGKGHASAKAGGGKSAGHRGPEQSRKTQSTKASKAAHGSGKAKPSADKGNGAGKSGQKKGGKGNGG